MAAVTDRDCGMEQEMLPMLSSLGVALDSDSCVDYTSFLRALETSDVGDAPEFKRTSHRAAVPFLLAQGHGDGHSPWLRGWRRWWLCMQR